VNTDNQRESTQETRDFYPVVRPSNTCLLSCCGVPMDEGCTQPLSSDPMINLNTTVFPFLVFLLFASRPYNDDHKRSTEVREGRATHTRLKSQQNHAHKSQLELKTQPTEFTTQMELKSLSQKIKCAKLES
jgi:hypothetical protein